MTSWVQRFTQVWLELAAVGDPEPVAQDLLERWAEPQRHYHTLDHLAHCLAGLDRHCALAVNAPVLEAALWFHDAVYDPRAADNELRSAALARDFLMRAKVSAPEIDRIEQLILATRTHESDGSADNALLLDLDLSVLGAPPADYSRYAQAIRQEYAWVPEPEYRHKRAEVLRHFLKRSKLFLTPPFQRLYEAQARHNLTTEIAQLVAGG